MKKEINSNGKVKKLFVRNKVAIHILFICSGGLNWDTIVNWHFKYLLSFNKRSRCSKQRANFRLSYKKKYPTSVLDLFILLHIMSKQYPKLNYSHISIFSSADVKINISHTKPICREVCNNNKSAAS